MQTVFIRFLTQDDMIVSVAFTNWQRARIASLPGEIYQLPIDALRILEDQHIAYRRATDAELKAAHDQVRNPTPAVL